jgi:UDP:flavonoid glycosyltransferase YjiC (YdhE family)
VLRILFSFVGGRGHLEPLVPLARAAAAAGHAVAFTADPAMVAATQARGFAAFPSGAPAPAGPPERRPLVAPDLAHEARVLREVFAGRLPRERLPGILAVAAAWQPDVVVCDEMDFAAAIAADRLALPHATMAITAAGTLLRPDAVAEPLDALRAEHGLPPDPGLERAALVLSPFPPSLRAVPLPANGLALRLDAAPGAPPAWLAALDGAIYFTLGTVVNLESGDLFTRALAGLRQLGPDVIVTVGGGIEPAELGPQPAHVHVERDVDQALVLPRCAVVVSHAGSGSLLGALAHGLPSVLLPIGADQPHNARRCSELGVGVALDVMTAAPATVRDAVRTVLDDPAYRRAAERIRDEIAALPGPEAAITRLEALA